MELSGRGEPRVRKKWGKDDNPGLERVKARGQI